MGLAGRKQKQRIPADPRNLSWADDASRFGLSYLSKFGWDASQGLGSSGDGTKTHLKAQQKLDMMGIGAQHQKDQNGIAWKQNKEFEALLKRLNENAEQGETRAESGMKGAISMGDKAFARAREGKVEGRPGDESSPSVSEKKRKHKDSDGPDTSEGARKKRRKEKKGKRQKSVSDTPAVPANSSNPGPPSGPSSSGPQSELPGPRPMAHRARIRAAKRVTDKSASAISEILGIAPSSSVATSTTTPARSTPSPSTPQSRSLTLGNLTISTKSVADYFKEKLGRSAISSASSSSAPSGSATPGLGATTTPGVELKNILPHDEGGPHRRGIGSRVPTSTPLVQERELYSVSGDGGDATNDLTEKLRRKAERKAERRKRREAETHQDIPAGGSAITKEQVGEHDAEGIPRTSKEKRREERQQQASAGDKGSATDDEVAKKKHNRSIAFLESNQKSRKVHKKKRA